MQDKGCHPERSEGSLIPPGTTMHTPISANMIREIPQNINPVSRDANDAKKINPLINELSGYLQLGMQRETIALARKILRKKTLSVEEFSDAVNALGNLRQLVSGFELRVLSA